VAEALKTAAWLFAQIVLALGCIVITGGVLMVTEVVAAELVQPFTVAVTE
jgi:hypothetical protein